MADITTTSNSTATETINHQPKIIKQLPIDTTERKYKHEKPEDLTDNKKKQRTKTSKKRQNEARDQGIERIRNIDIDELLNEKILALEAENENTDLFDVVLDFNQLASCNLTMATAYCSQIVQIMSKLGLSSEKGTNHPKFTTKAEVMAAIYGVQNYNKFENAYPGELLVGWSTLNKIAFDQYFKKFDNLTFQTLAHCASNLPYFPCMYAIICLGEFNWMRYSNEIDNLSANQRLILSRMQEFDKNLAGKGDFTKRFENVVKNLKADIRDNELTPLGYSSAFQWIMGLFLSSELFGRMEQYTYLIMANMLTGFRKNNIDRRHPLIPEEASGVLKYFNRRYESAIIGDVPM